MNQANTTGLGVVGEVRALSSAMKLIEDKFETDIKLQAQATRKPSLTLAL